MDGFNVKMLKRMLRNYKTTCNEHCSLSDSEILDWFKKEVKEILEELDMNRIQDTKVICGFPGVGKSEFFKREG